MNRLHAAVVAPYPIISTALFLGASIVLVWGAQREWTWPNPPGLHLTSDFHVTISPRGDLSFYNDPSYGPYSGSLLGIVIDGKEYPERIYSKGFGPTWGVYYRDFLWKNGTRLWTLSIRPYWVVAFFAIPIVWWLVRNEWGLFRLLKEQGVKRSTLKAPRDG